MPEHQARTASDDLYDHEREEPRSGRRRRPVADWGVGEDMFEHMPRNRFSRVAEGPPRDRRFSPAAGIREEPRRPAGADSYADGEAEAETSRGRATKPPEEVPRGRATEPPEDVPRVRATKPPGQVPRGRVDDGRRTIVIGKPDDLPSEIAAVTADRDLGDEPAPAFEPPPRPGERRTVRIGGRPEGSLEAARFHRDHSRRRPPRRAHERIGARPDRLAMWAVALGLLLIVIAILSAH